MAPGGVQLFVPKVEAIAAEALLELEQAGFNVVPIGLLTSAYQFVDNFEDFKQAVNNIGFPCVVKPIMSSSGHGQTILRNAEQIKQAWEYSQQGGRAGGGRVIVEGFVKFDYEITLLTVRHIGGTSFLAPIGHRQENGDYRESWQPQVMSATALENAQQVAEKITTALGGYGIFGVEMFVCSDEVIFNEVSPRPHDTGLVTLISQELSEFALHARAILGLPIPEINLISPAASKAIVVEGHSNQVQFANLREVLAEPHTNIRLFAKKEVNGHRRMGVLLARDESVEQALAKVERAYKKLEIIL